MASTITSRRRLLLLAAAALLAAFLAGAAASADTASSCTAGHGIPDPQYPLPGCSWYVSSLACKLVALYQPEIFREMCCQQLEAIPAACRCTALRVTAANPINMGSGGSETEACMAAQARSARSLVTAAECGLPAVHGWPNCSASGGAE